MIGSVAWAAGAAKVYWCSPVFIGKHNQYRDEDQDMCRAPTSHCIWSLATFSPKAFGYDADAFRSFPPDLVSHRRRKQEGLA
jgi:hypothetical protein